MAAHGAPAELSQFRELAKYYDSLNDWKDYRRESEQLDILARRFVRHRPTTWLDVACGTGRHLEFLKERYSTVGVDVSPPMLRIARRRLPGVRLIRADMRTFQLRRRFDVVTCLFSAIGHLASKADTRKAFSTFAAHLNPGGVAIIEPWIDRAEFHPGFLHLRTHEAPGSTVVRLSYSQVRGVHSVVRYHFLVGHPGRGVRHFEVNDVGLLLTRRELVQLMREAGLRPLAYSQGLTSTKGSRDLLIGLRP